MLGRSNVLSRNYQDDFPVNFSEKGESKYLGKLKRFSTLLPPFVIRGSAQI